MKATFAHGRVVLVTGASSGIGAATALLFAQNGYIVYGASRRGTLPEGAPVNLHPLVMDVTSDESVSAGVDAVTTAEGRVDILVHAAGNGVCGPAESCSALDAQAQLDVNYYGAIRLVNAVVPKMRERKQGLVILIGSVGGIFPIPFQTLYSSSKAALAMLALGLRMELKPYGVRAALIEPGDVRTGFTDARQYTKNEFPAYADACKCAISRMEKDERNGMPPIAVAKAVYAAAQRKNPRARRAVGGVYRVFVFLKRLLPERLVETLLYRMYLG